MKRPGTYSNSSMTSSRFGAGGTGISTGGQFHLHLYIVGNRTVLRMVFLLDVKKFHPRGYRSGSKLVRHCH